VTRTPLKKLLARLFGESSEQRRQYDGDRFEEYMVRNRKTAYRYVLMAIAVMLAPINAYNFYSENYIPAFAGLVVLALFLMNIVLVARDREPFLSALMVLMLTVALVLLSLIYGQNYNLYWVYPLLVALPVLLKTRVSVWLGILIGVLVTPFVLMRFDTNTAVIVFLSMAHTWLISAWLMYAASQQSRRLSELAVTDPLTGAYNRRHLKLEVKEAYLSYQRTGRPATLLLIDVDYFKRINDEFGHETGDQALCSIVDMITARLRALDHVYRYGGEEFVVLLQETDETHAIYVAEELRSQIEQANILPSGSITLSIGVCDVLQADSIDHWQNQCDRALYQAKAEGRNRVVIATPAPLA
jgi:diguanylate cyclase (GGDEF)-like protein